MLTARGEEGVTGLTRSASRCIIGAKMGRVEIAAQRSMQTKGATQWETEVAKRIR
jgi:hypothetical protein